MILRLVFTVAIVAASAAASGITALSTTAECGLILPDGSGRSSSMGDGAEGFRPIVNSISTCEVFDPLPLGAMDAIVRSQAEGTIYVPPPDRPSELGNNQLAWYARTSFGGPDSDLYGAFGTAMVTMIAFWTTAGPARAGLLEISYGVGGNATFSIGDFGCSSCFEPSFTTVPFQLGTPFRIRAEASVSANWDPGATGQFSSNGYVVFRAREVTGEIVPFEPTPEPATVGLMLLGVGALALGRRARRRGPDHFAAPNRIELGKRPPCA